MTAPAPAIATCSMADPPPRFSLVVATLGRADELRQLFRSLQTQDCTDFEVIVVDQNADDRLVPIIGAFAPTMPIRHVRAPMRNSSFARNAGVPYCTGDITAFPDDDCIYPAKILSFVADAFASDPQLGILTGPAITPTGKLGSGRWAPSRTLIGMNNAFTTVICFNMFLRRESLAQAGGFDEALGVGAEFGSCEENDLVVRSVLAGVKAVYDPTLRVVHPDKRMTPTAVARAFRYGTGVGYVLRKHRFSVSAVAIFLIRPLGGALVSLLRLRPTQAAYYWQTLRGRLYGWRAGRNVITRVTR